MKRIVSLVLAICFINIALAQDTLPGFTVVEKGNRVIVSWINPYENCIQLNVQRSYDSIRNFKTIYSATSPGLPQNGFSEARQPTNRTFYRIFYVLAGGAYFFSVSKQAFPDVAFRSLNLANSDLSLIKNITINSRSGRLAIISSRDFARFRDSVLRQTKDTLFAVNDSLVEIRRFVAKEVWRPSMFVFTNKEGLLNISLPDAGERKYHIKFFEDNGLQLFEIKNIKDQLLTFDKANFIHAGWFMFELYDDNKLKEKNKFYLPKDF